MIQNDIYSRRKTNQNTCINLVPVVDKVRKSERTVLTEGYSTKNGELALKEPESSIHAMESYILKMQLLSRSR